MAKPTGLIRAKGGAKTKNPQSAEQFAEGKKIGRPKQVWVWDESVKHEGVTMTQGHWEKTK